MRRLSIPAAILISLLAAASLQAQASAGDYEKVLFPIVLTGDGAYASHWNSEMVVYNDGDTTVDAAKPIFEGHGLCPAICGCALVNYIEPHQFASVCTQGLSDPMGLLYYPRASLAANLRFGSRIFDTSRSKQNAGSEVPVARERDFRSDRIVLANVPLQSLYRIAVRVYNPEQIDGAEVLMTILDPSGNKLGARTITLSYPIRTLVYDPYPIRPAYAYVGNVEQIVHEMQPNFALTSFHIALTPAKAGTRIWAIASVTNNDTQAVTTISPQ